MALQSCASFAGYASNSSPAIQKSASSASVLTPSLNNCPAPSWRRVPLLAPGEGSSVVSVLCDRILERFRVELRFRVEPTLRFRVEFSCENDLKIQELDFIFSGICR